MWSFQATKESLKQENIFTEIVGMKFSVYSCKNISPEDNFYKLQIILSK